jgi:hypothetical protein
MNRISLIVVLAVAGLLAAAGQARVATDLATQRSAPRH